MEMHLAYCSARDRIVRVAWEPALAGAEGDRLPDPSLLLCLEAGGSCTGSLCPLFAVPSPEMRERLLQSVAAG